jgi:outer membrane protein OmpA-like peptidoglycan-associated protein
MRFHPGSALIAPLVTLSLLGPLGGAVFAGTWQTPNWDHVPKPGPIQTPGQVERATAPVQTPGEIQVPKGIEAIRTENKACSLRISVVADALFDFDKADLRPEAEDTLAAAGPQIAAAGNHKVTVNGYTDGIGAAAYNDRLSEARARTVRDWLVDHGFIPLDSDIKGFGKRRPVAPNTFADGSDNPEGRQKNRRVEIEVDTCG